MHALDARSRGADELGMQYRIDRGAACSLTRFGCAHVQALRGLLFTDRCNSAFIQKTIRSNRLLSWLRQSC
jgi:hypothetical protein